MVFEQPTNATRMESSIKLQKNMQNMQKNDKIMLKIRKKYKNSK